VRGEGALLLDVDGSRFTDELAPRDQVTAAILDQMAAEGSACVWLDMRSLERGRFPSVEAAVLAAGFDPSADLIPVSPAAHYLVGGIVTDLDACTSVPGLYAVGECACTGVHGANRLASNSLSECFVFGSRAAIAAAAQGPAAPRQTRLDPSPWRFTPPTLETRAAVWRHAGPIRDEESLRPLLEDEYPLARMVAAAALRRQESRGTHRRSDYPIPNPDLDHVHFVHGRAGEIRAETW
jgi:L-aspartate oxidase